MSRLLRIMIMAGACALPALADTIAITGGTVLTGRGEERIANGTVLIRDGRIAAVGANVPVPAGATVVDASGRMVTPGIIAAMSDIGISEVDGVRETNDAGARQSPFSAALDLSGAINPNSMHIAINRLGGVTRAVVGPNAGNSIFGGQGAVISLADGGPTLTRARAFQYVELGENGGRLAGGSRPAAWAQFTNTLAEAQRLAANPKGFDRGQDSGALTKRLDAEALLPVLDGRQPVVFHAERASDIAEVLALKARYPKLRPILIGAREAWLVAKQISAAGVPVITHALYDLPDDFESLAASRGNAGHLQTALVLVAFAPLGGIGGTAAFNLPSYAGNAVAQASMPGSLGLSPGQALATITANPARMFGLNDLGTLEAGKRADVVVWDGDPLELMSAPVAVYIDGVAQPMTSRQTQLRDRYKDLSRSDLPLQYPH